MDTERTIQRARLWAVVLAVGLLLAFDERSVGVTAAVALLAITTTSVQLVLRRPRTRSTILRTGWAAFLADATVCAAALSTVPDPVDPIGSLTFVVAIEAAVRWGTRGAALGGLLAGTMHVVWATGAYAEIGRELPATSAAFRLLFTGLVALPVGSLIQHLRRQQERTQRLFEVSGDAIAVVHEGRVVEVNPAARRLVEAVGPFEGLLEERVGRLLRVGDLDPAPGSGPPETRQLPVTTGDGRRRWLAVRIEATPGNDHVFVTARDVTRERIREDDLRFKAMHDHLTGLPNRAALRSRLSRRLDAGDALGLVFLDLDGFKVVNDQHGHLVGDEVLVEVARRLRALTRVGDAYRWAGDEFCVTVDHADRDALDEVARRIADAFELGFAVDAGGTMLVRVGASLGKAIARPGDTVDDLVARADRHMYRGKGPGAGRRTERSSGPAHPRHGEAPGEAVGADGE